MNYRFLVFVCLLCTCTKVNEHQIRVDTGLFYKHLAFLSDDRLMGRDTGSPGYDSASLYIENFLWSIGLQPGGAGNSFRQPISFRSSYLAPSSASLMIGNRKLVPELDYSMTPVSDKDSVVIDAPLVFAGMGIHNPDLGYSDFENIDVSGKVVMIVLEAPKSFGMVERAVSTSDKVSNEILKQMGALAVIRIIPESYYQVRSWQTMVERNRRPKLNYQSHENDPALASVMLSHQAAEDLFNEAGNDFTEVLARLLNGISSSFDLDLRVRLSARMIHQELNCHNLAGIMPGADPELKDEFIVMTAHLDHIGIGHSIKGDSINNGTLDNASGSAALMVVAKALSRLPPPNRSILFLWVTGEEKGLLGSDYFARRSPLADLHIAANLNIDGIIGMIVETSDVIAYGYHHSNLSESVDYAVEQLGMYVSEDPQPEQNIFVRSDQYSFVKQGYPALYVVSGRTATNPRADGLKLFNDWLQHRYHQPSDDMSQPMSEAGIEKELNLNLLIAHHMANRVDSIKWNEDSFLYHMFSGH